LNLYALTGFPLIQEGDNLAAEIIRAAERSELGLLHGDILAVAQKIVSKAEGREVSLGDIEPSPEAGALAEETGKDPRLVELILRESEKIIRTAPGTIIARNRLGFVQAHAGIDQSNIDHRQGERALLLPVDPDASAKYLRDRIFAGTGARVGIIVMDSMNRPWPWARTPCPSAWRL